MIMNGLKKSTLRKFDIEYMVELTENDLYLGEFLLNVGRTVSRNNYDLRI